MIIGKDGAICRSNLGTDIGCFGSTSQYIEKDAVRAQGQRWACLHLSHHLNSMSAVLQASHRQIEAAIRRAASGDGLRIALHAIDIQCHNLGAGTTYGKRYVYRLIISISTECHAVGNIE